MADFHRIITDLRAELARQIESLVPNRPIDPSMKFNEMSEDSDDQNIRSKTCDPRTFQIQKIDQIEPMDVGGNTVQNKFMFPILFSYPNTDRWTAAAADDIGKLRDYLNKTQSTVSGVGGRWVLPEEAITSEKVAEDARRIWFLNVSAFVDVTY